MEQNDIGVCQEALAYLRQEVQLGANMHTDPATKAEKACHRIFDPARRAFLASHDWNFARTRAAYSTTKPSAALRVVEVTDSAGATVRWKAYGATLDADTGAAHVWYTADKTDVTTWPALARSAFALYLARELAIVVSARQEDLKAVDAMYQERYAAARLADLREGEPGDSRAVEVMALLRGAAGVTPQLEADACEAAYRRLGEFIDAATGEVVASHEWSGAPTTYEGLSDMAQYAALALAAHKVAGRCGAPPDVAKALWELYEQKLRRARVKDLSETLDTICDNSVIPFVFATTGENQATGTQRTRAMWKFAIGASMVAKAGGTVSAVTVRTHRQATDPQAYQLVLFALSGGTHAFLAGSKNTVTPTTAGSLVTWNFDDVAVPMDAVLVCRIHLGYVASQDELADIYSDGPDSVGISYTFPAQLSPTISTTEFAADAGDFAYWDNSDRHGGITAAVRLYSYEARATSLQATAQKTLRRIFPFMAEGDAPLPYSITAFANAVNASALEAENEVRRTLGTDSLDALSMSAAEALAAAKVAPVARLDANFAQLRLQEYAAKVAEWRKLKLNEALASNTDPVLAVLVSNFGSDDASLLNAFTAYTARAAAVKGTVRDAMLSQHHWNFARKSVAFTETRPSDCVRVLRVLDADGARVEWSVRGDAIEAPGATGGTLVYTALVEPEGWPPLARAAFASACAAEIAQATCGGEAGVAAAARLDKLAAARLAAARAADLNEDRTGSALVREVIAILKAEWRATDAELDGAADALAERLEDMLDGARREVMTAHRWNFARRTAKACVQRTDGECFTMRPPGCVRVEAVKRSDGELCEWSMRGRFIVSRESPAEIVYIADEEDLDMWPPSVRRALVYRLAADASLTMARAGAGRPDAESFMRLYERKLSDAAAQDAREGNPGRAAWGRRSFVEAMRRGDAGMDCGRRGGGAW